MADLRYDLLPDVVGGLYLAAQDAHLWPSALDRLRVLFGGSKACLGRYGAADDGDALSSPCDETYLLTMLDYASDNPLGHAVAGAPFGQVYSDAALVGFERHRRSRFFNEWMAPQDMYGGLGCKVMTDGQSFWFVDVQRGRKQVSFDRAEADLFARIVPHVARAGKIARDLEIARTMASSFALLPFGLLIVDRRMRLVTANAAAEAALSRPGGPLLLRDGVLRAKAPHETKALEALVGDACSAVDGVPGRGGDILLRGGQNGVTRCDFAVSVGPLPDPAVNRVVLQRCASLHVREVALRLPDGFADQARAFFALSPQEARIAARLTGGRSLREAAEDEGVAYATARSYLETIFRKTGTRQQSQLVALLKSALPA